MPASPFDPIESSVVQQRRVIQIRFAREGGCAICMEPMLGRTVVVQPCGHPFHLKCERRLRASRCPTRAACPLCRRSIQASDDRGSCDADPPFEGDTTWWIDMSVHDIEAIIRSLLS